jgi:hypothetical protein
MHALITWSLAAVGYFASLWLVLWFTHRVETELDDISSVAIEARRRRTDPRRHVIAAPDIPGSGMWT